MSLAVAFKGPEGIVLAADSRVTLTGQTPDGVVIPSYFDSATKLLSVQGQAYVGAVTYGQGAIGQSAPRTAHSYVPEFEAYLGEQNVDTRLTVHDFAEKLGQFFLERWKAAKMPPDAGAMVFLVGGFDPDAAYGSVFEIQVPTAPAPDEKNPKDEFGLTFGGQQEFVGRLVGGADPRLVSIVGTELGLDASAQKKLATVLTNELSLPIPYQFLPLQDCVDLSMFLVSMTARIQTWTVGVRGVGGAIDVATITRTDGFRSIQQKEVQANG